MKDDPVNHPSHYNRHPSGIECIDIAEHFTLCTGSAIQYIWRAGKKGSAIEDYEKAIWYLNREIERLKREDNATKGSNKGTKRARKVARQVSKRV